MKEGKDPIHTIVEEELKIKILRPDYTISNVQSKINGPLKKTMYPVSLLRANSLNGLGVTVYKVIHDREVDRYKKASVFDFIDDKNQFCVQKRTWVDFYSQPYGESFVRTLFEVSQITRNIYFEKHKEDENIERKMEKLFFSLECDGIEKWLDSTLLFDTKRFQTMYQPRTERQGLLISGIVSVVADEYARRLHIEDKGTFPSVQKLFYQISMEMYFRILSDERNAEALFSIFKQEEK